MQKYKDIDNDSGVQFYDEGDDWIAVIFRDGRTYVYTDASAGTDNVQKMKHLAHIGEGLNAFINKHVRRKYESSY